MVYDYNENVYDSSECNYLHPFFSILQSQISNENMCFEFDFQILFFKFKNKCNNSSVSWFNCHQCDKDGGKMKMMLGLFVQ